MATAQAESAERGYRSLASLFRPVVIDSKKCHRCKGAVYQVEKIGPVHDVLFHKSCFKCVNCGQALTLKNYYSNQVDGKDREVYCHAHVPRVGAARLDQGALGIKSAVNAQKGYRQMSKKTNSQVRELGTIRGPHYDYEAVAIKRATTAPKAQDPRPGINDEVGHKSFAVDADALHIRGPLDAQLLTKGYQRKLDKHHYPPNIYKKKQRLIDAQKKLEEEFRKEEDILLQEIQNTRKQEVRRLSDELKNEWEVKLKELTEKFEREMSSKKKKKDADSMRHLTMNFENQKKEIASSIAMKKEKKKETMTLRLREKEQRKTAELVTKQSKEMLDLLATKQEELKQELKQELEVVAQSEPINGHTGDPEEQAEVIEQALEALEITDTEIPPPHPPSCRKSDVFSDVSVFKDIDDQVIKVAEGEQMTYTDLVQQLTENLVTDLEKVRAIYRWITVKDLNVMEFDETLQTDTPMGLLRGIKYGTETYHVLFLRLCSYTGLHCVEVKGHSKSVGYEPGMKITSESFQNTWNAVLIDGDWRLIQCNWGARHLVLNKDKHKQKQQAKSKDHIRYQYDEHYFLTDPDEFIQEFWSSEPNWQLIENPITLEEFETLPFVRSVFFHYGMHFERGMMSVVETTEKGGCEIKIKIPEDLENDLVFYYQLRFAEKDRRHEATYRGANLERFVFQTMIDNTVMFSVHVPTVGDYFFEVFANKIEESNKMGSDDSSVISPFRLKCACKFKITCGSLSGKMHPLPDCASGEWGPKKGRRHFGVRVKSVKNADKKAIQAPDPGDEKSDRVSDTGSSGSGSDTPDNPKAGILNVEDKIELEFRIPRPLHFVPKLKMNDADDKALAPFVHAEVEGDILKLTVSPPQVGQYGVDLYARPKDAPENATLSHAFKYLLNCTKVTSPVEIPKAAPKSQNKREKWGPTPQFESLGLKCLSHKEPKITCTDSNQVAIEMLVPETVHMTYQFLKEPDEESRDYVSMGYDDNDHQKVKFFINLPGTGNYMLSLFGRLKDTEDKSMPNIYNFLIIYKKSSTQTNGNVSKTEERRSSSIFKKGFFKKSEKDKDKSKEEKKDKKDKGK